MLYKGVRYFFCAAHAQYLHSFVYLCRGDTFCVAFSHLGVIRSLQPELVNLMALTVTTTKDTRQVVC